MTAGTKIFWRGDFANEPKRGVIASVSGGMVSISWNDGSTTLVPSFTILPNYGWIVG